jgi:hypothetical protein
MMIPIIVSIGLIKAGGMHEILTLIHHLIGTILIKIGGGMVIEKLHGERKGDIGKMVNGYH